MSGPLLSAQDQDKSAQEMRAAELVEQADLLLKTEQYDKAIPYLKSYLTKFGDLEETRIIMMAQDVRFKLGKIMATQTNAAEAAVYFEDYVNERPAPKWHEAMKLLSLSLMEAKQYERCVELTLEALAGPTNEIDLVVEEIAVGDEEEEDSGLKYDEFGEIITEEEAAAGELDPSGYTRADMVILNTTLGEAYTALGEAEKSIAPFLYVAENETVAVRRGYAIMRTIEAMVDMRQFDELTRLIPPLYQTDARYDIRVNLAIMTAASSLFDAKQYDDALLMYRMILPREVLINFQSKRIKRMQFDAGLITLNDLTKDEAIELGIDVSLFGKSTKVVTEEIWYERGQEDTLKSQELIDLEQLVDTLIDLQPYEQDVMFRTAYLYDTVDRPWEAVEQFNQLWEENPESDIGQRAFYEANRVLFDKLDGGEKAEEQCYAFLETHKNGLVPRQIAYLLTRHYQQVDEMASVKKIRPYLEEFVPAADPLARRYDVELYYMQAIADLMMFKYEEAKASFELVLERFPASHQEDNATYWRSMTLMFLEKFTDAYAAFEAYLEKFPKGKWVASANFQMGTCLFGEEKYEAAKERFTRVIEQFPGSPPYPDACSMRGDILGSEEGDDKLDLAIADYQEAIRAAKESFDKSPARSKKQASYATFQMVTAYDLLASAYKDHDEVVRNEYYEKIVAAIEDYLDFYGARANISRGIYWIGRTRINQGRVDEAVQSYLDAIVEYGDDLEQDGVDLMIAELAMLAHRRVKGLSIEQVDRAVQDALQEADNLTLQLRLRALLAQLNQTEVEFGKELITELDDLSFAAPPVLSAISKASFEQEDYSRAGEILKVFKTQFNDSEFIRPVYKLRATDLYESGDLDEALKIIKETQERYGWDKAVVWAQMMKSDILIQKGDYEEANKQLLLALNQPAWRGAPYAEATYRLGMSAEAEGDLRKAFGWYQRAYFQYKGYADGYWAAEAYLASARCLEKMGRMSDVRNTYRAMLFDKYVNDLPQANVAREALGKEEVLEIIGMITSGSETNITVTLDAEAGE